MTNIHFVFIIMSSLQHDNSYSDKIDEYKMNPIPNSNSILLITS